MPTLTCPVCAAQMTVAPSAPAKLLCPNCRGAVWNPHAGVAPLPVIPLDTQVERDLRTSRWLLVFVALAAIAGAIASIFLTVSGKVALNPWVIIACVIVAAGSLVALIPLPYPLGPQRRTPVGDDAMTSQLSYARPDVNTRPGVGWVILSLFLRIVMTGFFAVILIVGMFVLLVLMACGAMLKW
jgi:hypothetical protein